MLNATLCYFYCIGASVLVVVLPSRACAGNFSYTVSNDFDVKALAPEASLEDSAMRKSAKKALANIFYEKFMNPVNEKAGKVSKDVLFLRKKLRF